MLLVLTDAIGRDVHMIVSIPNIIFDLRNESPIVLQLIPRAEPQTGNKTCINRILR